MNTIEDGDSAFPRPVSWSEKGGTHRGTLGMTLRDYFAGQALAGVVPGIEHDVNKMNLDAKYSDQNFYQLHQCAAIRAYCYADAMLAARKEAIT